MPHVVIKFYKSRVFRFDLFIRNTILFFDYYGQTLSLITNKYIVFETPRFVKISIGKSLTVFIDTNIYRENNFKTLNLGIKMIRYILN